MQNPAAAVAPLHVLTVGSPASVPTLSSHCIMITGSVVVLLVAWATMSDDGHASPSSSHHPRPPSPQRLCMRDPASCNKARRSRGRGRCVSSDMTEWLQTKRPVSCNDDLSFWHCSTTSSLPLLLHHLCNLPGSSASSRAPGVNCASLTRKVLELDECLQPPGRMGER